MQCAKIYDDRAYSARRYRQGAFSAGGRSLSCCVGIPCVRRISRKAISPRSK